jgi:hypothetical protein
MNQPPPGSLWVAEAWVPVRIDDIQEYRDAGSMFLVIGRRGANRLNSNYVLAVCDGVAVAVYSAYFENGRLMKRVV